MEQKTFKERQRENKEPIQYAIYKGATGKFGALRLNLKKAYTDQRRDAGCVFLDMAPATAPNVYDWESNKIIMALSTTDISKIILYLRAPNHPVFSDGKLKLYHDRGAGTADKGKDVTSLELSKQPDRNNIFISAYQKREGTEKKATTTISPDEALAIGTLLQAAIPQILAWD